MGSQIGRRVRREREGKMPPLLSRVNGQIEVLGFNIRQRRAFVNSVLRYGLPPPPSSLSMGGVSAASATASTAWHSRDLKGKPERVFRAYVALFMRHLCEPESMNQDNNATYSDGTPRDGISHQPILSRIGVMALVRKKVQEFEQINGLYSIPDSTTAPETASVAGTDATTSNTAASGEGGGCDRPEGSSTPLTQPLCVAVTSSNPSGNGGASCSDDASKASDKTEPMDISIVDESTAAVTASTAPAVRNGDTDAAAATVALAIDEGDALEPEGGLKIDESGAGGVCDPMDVDEKVRKCFFMLFTLPVHSCCYKN
ncbi:unnamed protein product [Hydatigera taeniaeformis]|uniref:DUF1086 domain-containing protein n=1 Tax=Hydatigena taeniaeformis TaxID=6205 RepID=A0A0R3WT79_HYDTA|nr:unnamed protein product [Hydatigera taeniaeformis]